MKMPKSQGCKNKLLLLERFFESRTDEEHYVTLSDILAELSSHGISAERKSIYSDINTLREMGMDIRMRGRNGYYLAERTFSADDIRLLFELVLSSKYVPAKKSAELCEKLKTLTSAYHADNIKRNIFPADRAKASDIDARAAVNAAETAINSGKTMSFCYVSYISGRDIVYENGGEPMTVSPLAVMTVNGEFIIAADYNGDVLPFYAERISEPSVGDADGAKRKFNAQEFADSIRKFRSEKADAVTIECESSVLSRMYGIFGRDMTVAEAEGTALVSVKCGLTEEFFGAVASFGGKARVILPEDAAEEYERFAEKISG